MKKLIELENKFQQYLLQSTQDIHHHIVSTNKVPAEIRLNIYRHAYYSRLQEALSTSYPILEIFLGAERFETLCRHYIDHLPSEYRSIRWFGDSLAEFLRQEVQYQDYPFVTELAKLEWTMALVFDAADSSVIQLEEMSSIDPELWMNMRLQVHPSLRLLTLSWNVVQLWQDLTDANQAPDMIESPCPTSWIFWRNDLDSQFSCIPEDEAWAVNAMMNQATFGEICEGICQWHDEQDAGMRAASLLKGWVSAGLVAQIMI